MGQDANDLVFEELLEPLKIALEFKVDHDDGGLPGFKY